MHTACKWYILVSPTTTSLKPFPLFATRISADSESTLSSWFIVGQLFASVALYCLKASAPLNYKTPIYTQVSQ